MKTSVFLSGPTALRNKNIYHIGRWLFLSHFHLVKTTDEHLFTSESEESRKTPSI